MIKNNYKAFPPFRACPSSPLPARLLASVLAESEKERKARSPLPARLPASVLAEPEKERKARSPLPALFQPPFPAIPSLVPPRRSGVFANHLHLMVMVGTKCEESARVVMLFSCCCLWFFPITRPAVHELVRKVTMAEHTATMRYLMNAFIFGFIRFSCPLLTFRLLF